MRSARGALVVGLVSSGLGPGCRPSEPAHAPPVPPASTAKPLTSAPAATAREVAAAWLAALASGDVEALARLSSIALTVSGFWPESGSNGAGCGMRSGGVDGLSMRVSDRRAVAKLVKCVARDAFLMGALPAYRASEWPETLGRPDTQQRVGYLRALGELPLQLGWYTREISSAAKGGAPFEFFATDQHGALIYGVIVVRAAGRESLVVGVFMSERYEG